MSEFVKVAKLSDIPDRCAKCIEIKGRRIGLFNVDGEIHAIDDLCTHAEASLCDGEIVGDEVMCPLHFATFNLRTGEATAPPADEAVRTYPVRINGDDVEVQV